MSADTDAPWADKNACLDPSRSYSPIRLNVALELDARFAMLQLIERGLYCSILSHTGVHAQLARGTVVSSEVVDPTIRRTICLCQSKRAHQGPAQRAVATLLAELYVEPVSEGVWQAGLLSQEPQLGGAK